ncbi:unnamed protein product, partial [Rhizoctonia solani]
FNQYVATLDDGKSGKQQAAAQALKKKWTIRDEEWDMLAELVRVLEPFEFATRVFSTRGRTVLHSVLSTYALLRIKLVESQERLNALYGPQDPFGIVGALLAGKDKLDEYFSMAKDNSLILIASILHPGMRLSYFQDTEKSGTSGPLLARRGRELLEHLYKDYKLALSDSTTDSATQPTRPTIINSTENWFDNLLNVTANQPGSTLFYFEELNDYFDGKYRYKCGDILVWWEENELYFPILSQIARDFLAIPAT